MDVFVVGLIFTMLGAGWELIICAWGIRKIAKTHNLIHGVLRPFTDKRCHCCGGPYYGYEGGPAREVETE